MTSFLSRASEALVFSRAFRNDNWLGTGLEKTARHVSNNVLRKNFELSSVYSAAVRAYRTQSGKSLTPSSNYYAAFCTHVQQYRRTVSVTVIRGDAPDSSRDLLADRRISNFSHIAYFKIPILNASSSRYADLISASTCT